MGDVSAARRDHAWDVDIEVSIHVFGNTSVLDRRCGVKLCLMSGVKSNTRILLESSVRIFRI